MVLCYRCQREASTCGATISNPMQKWPWTNNNWLVSNHVMNFLGDVVHNVERRLFGCIGHPVEKATSAVNKCLSTRTDLNKGTQTKYVIYLLSIFSSPSLSLRILEEKSANGITRGTSSKVKKMGGESNPSYTHIRSVCMMVGWFKPEGSDPSTE